MGPRARPTSADSEFSSSKACCNSDSSVASAASLLASAWLTSARLACPALISDCCVAMYSSQLRMVCRVIPVCPSYISSM